MVGAYEERALIEKCRREERDVKLAYLEPFAEAGTLRHQFPLSEFSRIPAGAIGLYSYIQRLKQGLQQLMAGARKFALRYLSRDDLFALTREAAEISGIPYVMEADYEEGMRILG